MPLSAASSCLSRTRSHHHSSSAREPRKLTRPATAVSRRPDDSLATIELDSRLPSIRIARKPRKTFKRRLILLWKRLTGPGSRPRASRRFSFMPPDFDVVSPDAHMKSKRASRRRTKYFETLVVEDPQTELTS